MARKPRPKGTGRVRQLPSGRWQARFTGPDGQTRPAPATFDTRLDAQTWLAGQQRLVDAGAWSQPAAARPSTTLRAYAEDWLEHRPIKARTRAQYRWLLDAHILPPLGDLPLDTVTTFVVRRWVETTAPGRATTRAQSYGLLRTILGTAVADGVLAANPANVRGAGSTSRSTTTEVLSPAEVEALAAAMPERLRAAVVLSAWCGLRFGETTELRRSDIDTEQGTVSVTRAVVRVRGGVAEVTTPKSRAGVRTVAIPPHVLPAVMAHLAEHVGPGQDALLFPAAHGGHLAPSALYGPFYKARTAVGRPAFRWHDLRHTGLTFAAQAGATLADLMARAGHSSPQAAIRYQHAAQGRDRLLAERMSAMVAGEGA
jgi:integrase